MLTRECWVTKAMTGAPGPPPGHLITTANTATRLSQLAPGFWVRDPNSMARPHRWEEVKEQRAHLQVLPPMGPGWGRRGQQHGVGVAELFATAHLKTTTHLSENRVIPRVRHCLSFISAGPMAPLPPRLRSSSPCPAPSCPGPLNLPAVA